MSYDPNKRYTWSNSDQFTISGRDFGLFLNTFRAILSNDNPLPVNVVILADKANEAIEALMAEYVEKGVIIEASEEKVPEMKVKKGK
jgi:hypothetical protein